MSKICTMCKITKPLIDFGNSKSGRLGKTERCKLCRALVVKEEYNDPVRKAAIIARSEKWRQANLNKVNIRSAKWRELNREDLREYNRQWARLNPEKCSAKTMARFAAKLKAVPKLSTDEAELNHLAMYEAYDLASRRSRVTNFKWHVDHIVPLRSKVVCGLHCYRNIRVISAYENLLKSNKEWEHQWL